MNPREEEDVKMVEDVRGGRTQRNKYQVKLMKVVNLHQMISNNFVMRKASNAHYINSAKDTTTK